MDTAPRATFAIACLNVGVGRLRRPVGPEDARLPAVEVSLVGELEVEEGADRGLAVGELDRRRELRALVGREVVVGLGAAVPAVWLGSTAVWNPSSMYQIETPR